MSLKTDIDALLQDNTTGLITPGSLRNAFQFLTDMIDADRLGCGFNREDTTTLGILQFCYDASSQVVEQIDEDGVRSTLTSQTHFADGTTVLADRTVAHYHSSGETSFSYGFRGSLVEVTTLKTCQIPDDSSAHYTTYDSSGDLVLVTDSRESIVSEAMVSFHLSNSTESEHVWFADERHGRIMDGMTHMNTHMQRGMGWIYGCEIEGLADNGETFTKITAGLCGDEDIPMTYAEITETPFMYLEGTGGGAWRITPTASSALGHFVDSKLVYNRDVNGDGTEFDLSETNADYVIVTGFATNNYLNPVVRVIGQTLYLNRGVARDHMEAALYELKMNHLPSQEMVPLFSYILHNESTGQIEHGANDEVWIDHRHGHPVGRF